MRIKAGVPDAQYYVIHDTDNDVKIDNVIAANDQTGEYTQVVMEEKKGNIEIIDVRDPNNKELLERIDPHGHWKMAINSDIVDNPSS